MKKINVLLLALILSVTVFCQTPFNPINLNEKAQKGLIERSTLIIEGKIIEAKGPILDNNSKGGYYYGLYKIKPIAVLKGNTDSTKTYQFLIKRGEYNFEIHDGQYCSNYFLNPSENAWIIPDNGIFFINETPTTIKNNFLLEMPDFKLVPIDLFSLFPASMMVDFKNCINFGKKYPKEKTLKYLQDKFGLAAVPLK